MAAPTPNDLTPFLTERTWESISKRLIVRSGCWGYTAKPGTGNYHSYAIYQNGRRISARLHRIVYGFLVGPIGPELQLDHLCRERSCLNPWHCEAVPQKENILRGLCPTAVNAAKVNCIKGHPLIPRAGAGMKRRYCPVCFAACYTPEVKARANARRRERSAARKAAAVG